MSSLNPNHLLKGPVSTHSHIRVRAFTHEFREIQFSPQFKGCLFQHQHEWPSSAAPFGPSGGELPPASVASELMPQQIGSATRGVSPAPCRRCPQLPHVITISVKATLTQSAGCQALSRGSACSRSLCTASAVDPITPILLMGRLKHTVPN